LHFANFIWQQKAFDFDEAQKVFRRRTSGGSPIERFPGIRHKDKFADRRPLSAFRYSLK
jgi:hypothetical protein